MGKKPRILAVGSAPARIAGDGLRIATAPGQKTRRVLRHAIDQHFEMQVRPRGAAGVADQGHDLELDDMNNSIPAAPRVFDLTGDGLADRMYVGDTGGRLWRLVDWAWCGVGFAGNAGGEGDGGAELAERLGKGQ